MTNRTSYPPRTDPADAERLADAVERAGGVEAVAQRLGVEPEFVRECLAGRREWPEWAEEGVVSTAPRATHR